MIQKVKVRSTVKCMPTPLNGLVFISREITKYSLDRIRKQEKQMKATAKSTKRKKPYKTPKDHPWQIQNRALLNG